ncbi:hypothetical protein L2734_00740 [Parashewanella spongiae]|uniref:hypothetical protein n=1 Tax=Parashewanella spongiae TaxID=342950 RepID=UPI001404D65A|nr:hypothetical protein [Parashewanella spongiae]MCL1076712.1 hypothetical protein [Parashewanella spongiae]
MQYVEQEVVIPSRPLKRYDEVQEQMKGDTYQALELQNYELERKLDYLPTIT